MSSSDSFIEFYECLICSEIVQNNRECKNCHKLFCLDCIMKWLKVHENCPHCNHSPVACKSAEDNSAFIHNHHSEMIANSITVPCPNADCGCDIKKIARGDLALHLEKFCTGRTVPCKHAKYGCEWSGQYLKLDEHLREECPFSKEIILKALEKLETNISELTRENEQLRSEKASSEEKIKALEEKGLLNNSGIPMNQSTTVMVNGVTTLGNDITRTATAPMQIPDSSLPPWAQPNFYSSFNPSYSGTTSFYNSAGVSSSVYPPPPSGVPMTSSSSMYSSMMSSSMSYNPPLMTSSSFMNGSTMSTMPIHTVECGICKKTNFSGVLYQCTSCINFSICSACYSTLQITQTHDRMHTFLPLRKVRGKISGVTWLRLATCGSSVSLPLADNDNQDLEFYVNERTGAITPFMPIGVPNAKSISGSWTSVSLHLAIYWPNTTRAIVMEGNVGTLPTMSCTLQGSTLKFTVKASGMGGRGVAGDGGYLTLTLSVS
ncbi:hypothetical protein C9374_011982 [Naegleria lovaniensis]|uniref:RING-type domain-containing protein n=1 Tax=Naegleria lovaniensis TaxID=51637 RepID=A0AA88GF28_NAELO|nr:uncharacterized protein C9374_011982 [Naegleria lovaniensis]KAG2373693.1 hypothetical protein C9374_011982 [Naegleria lovaniensis]